MGLFDRLQAATDPTGIRRTTRAVMRDTASRSRVDRLQETALRAALNHIDVWATGEAPWWRGAGWPDDTINRYESMEQAWLTTAGALLVDAGYDPEDDTFDIAAAWVAAHKLEKGTVPGAQGGRLVLEAFAHYGHPYPCEDAHTDWCQGWCDSDWRRWTWRWDGRAEVFVADERGEPMGLTIAEPGWIQFARF